MRQLRLTATSLAVVTMLALSLAGCGTLAPEGVYQGDKIAYNAELSIVTSKNLLTAFVSWEHENRAALTAVPDIRKHADVVRANAKQWTSSAIAVTEAYKANPTPENKDALATALRVIRTALVEANGYMLKAAGGTQ